MREIILINVSGKDQPGITAAISSILARYEIDILDMGQAVIHNTLSIGILIEVLDESSSVLKDVLFKTSELGVNVWFTPITESSYEEWVSAQGKERYIVTLLGRQITAVQIGEITRIVAENGLNIDNISRLSGRIDLDPNEVSNKACIEFSLRGKPTNIDRMRAEFLKAANETGADIAFQKDSAFRRNRRLVCFDMDSTLIETEVIDELAKAAGVGEQVAGITEKAMRGELDFTQSFEQRVGLLKGLNESVLSEIAERLPLTEGAVRLVKSLRALGYKTAILSGGFSYFGRILQEKLGIDYVYANELEIENGKVTGNVVGQVVDGKRKAELLKSIAEKEGINLQQVIAVGDGANDLPMLGVAGLGIAFRAKPLVKENAEHSISTLGLDGILYLLGVRDQDQMDLLSGS